MRHGPARAPMPEARPSWLQREGDCEVRLFSALLTHSTAYSFQLTDFSGQLTAFSFQLPAYS